MNKIVNGVANDYEFPQLDWTHHDSTTIKMPSDIETSILAEEILQLVDEAYKYKKECERLNNIINDVYEFVEWHYKDNQEFYKNKGIGLNYPECDYILNKLKELKEGK